MRRGLSRATRSSSVLLLVLAASLGGCALIAGLEEAELTAGAGGQAAGGTGGASTSSGASQSSGGGAAATTTTTTNTTATGTGGATASTTGGGGAPDAYAAAILGDNPIAYFRFDDPVGSAAATNEINGSSITAVYPASNATLESPGINAGGNAVHFDDTGARLSVFGGVDFPDDQTFTLETWVKIEAAGGNGLYNQIDNQAPGGRDGSSLFITSADLVRTEVWLDGVIIMYNLTTTSPPVNQYFHIALRHRSGEADELYINAAAATGQQLDPGERPMMSKTFEWGNFVGSMDEFAVYDYALTDAQIAAHFVAGS